MKKKVRDPWKSGGELEQQNIQDGGFEEEIENAGHFLCSLLPQRLVHKDLNDTLNV